ncbi:MAG: Stp1/IreP family PP2C-type Ser/Thr phosphatase [Actinomycetota bacterium]|nr:Stp1/IreP family PP2C-type Ser/Thr phosphatase [Actinomycetota bacterium]
MTYTWSTATHPGLVRRENEDAVYPGSSGKAAGPVLVAVADGMGGHAAGDVASRLAIEAAVSLSAQPEERVTAANRAVVQASLHQPELAGMGTTLTLASLEADGRLTIGHVGDSRAYLWRHGELRQLTTDHSLMAEYLAAGRIGPEEVGTHPQRSVITRALGMEPEVDVDVLEEQLVPGDRLLLCSDGLTAMVAEAQMAQLLDSSRPLEEAAWDLVEAANRAGGEDNISVILVEVSP